jgi:DNA-binding transcriptional MerR regulator
MNIGQLAKLTGASARSIRHYEKAGLLASNRSSNGYRDFGVEAVPRVRQIARMIRLGFSLDEIATFPDCMRKSTSTALCPIALAAHRERLAEVEQQISDLELLRRRLVETLEQATQEGTAASMPSHPLSEH